MGAEPVPCWAGDGMAKEDRATGGVVAGVNAAPVRATGTGEGGEGAICETMASHSGWVIPVTNGAGVAIED